MVQEPKIDILKKYIADKFIYTGKNLICKNAKENKSKKYRHKDGGYIKMHTPYGEFKEDTFVWIMHYNEMPDFIIHKNGDRKDSSIENLKNIKFETLEKNCKDVDKIYRVAHQRFYYKDGELYRTGWSLIRHKPIMGTKTSRRGEYRTIQINKFRIQKHRLIFLMHHGYLPKIIDHIDRNVLNNRIENLRSATPQINEINKGRACNNTSGRKGVCWHKGVSKWRAFINIAGEHISLGVFHKIEDAIDAREIAEKEYWGDLLDIKQLQTEGIF